MRRRKSNATIELTCVIGNKNGPEPRCCHTHTSGETRDVLKLLNWWEEVEFATLRYCERGISYQLNVLLSCQRGGLGKGITKVLENALHRQQHIRRVFWVSVAMASTVFLLSLYTDCGRLLCSLTLNVLFIFVDLPCGAGYAKGLSTDNQFNRLQHSAVDASTDKPDLRAAISSPPTDLLHATRRHKNGTSLPDNAQPSTIPDSNTATTTAAWTQWLDGSRANETCPCFS